VGNSSNQASVARTRAKEGITESIERDVMYMSASYGCLSRVLLTNSQHRREEKDEKREKGMAI
jgi:hypothetical protein